MNNDEIRRAAQRASESSRESARSYASQADWSRFNSNLQMSNAVYNSDVNKMRAAGNEAARAKELEKKAEEYKREAEAKYAREEMRLLSDRAHEANLQMFKTDSECMYGIMQINRQRVKQSEESLNARKQRGFQEISDLKTLRQMLEMDISTLKVLALGGPPSAIKNSIEEMLLFNYPNYKTYLQYSEYADFLERCLRLLENRCNICRNEAIYNYNLEVMPAQNSMESCQRPPMQTSTFTAPYLQQQQQQQQSFDQAAFQEQLASIDRLIGSLQPQYNSYPPQQPPPMPFYNQQPYPPQYYPNSYNPYATMPPQHERRNNSDQCNVM